VEQAAGERTTGYMMDFFGNGWEVASEMGIRDEIESIKYPLDSLSYVDSRGKAYFTVPISRFKEAFDGRYTYIRRQDLERVLLNAVKRMGASVTYNTRASSITQTETRAQVMFDGPSSTSGEYDLVIGADGVHSEVRKIVFGDEQKFAHYLGYAVCAFETAIDPSLMPSQLVMYQEPSIQCGWYPVSETCMDVLYIFPVPKGHLHSPEIKKLLRTQIAGSGTLAETLLKTVGDEQITYVDGLEQIRMPTWHKGRVALVGDASACLTPIAGQGASMAMFEAFALMDALSKSEQDIDKALISYETLLMGDVAKRQRAAESLVGEIMPTSRFGVWRQRMMMRAAFSPLLIKYTARSFTGHLFAI
jgi:2-polyprenyl-6-methoxyphenol hydroxylase-like FAD-dependent oxidoreductase